MAGELKYITFNTTMGWVGILGSAEGLVRATLPQFSPRKAHRLLGKQVNYADWSHNRFDDLIERFRIYLNGGNIAFPDRLDLSGAAPFQRKVWGITRLIPYGETRSYTWVAEQIKKPKAVRAAGQALAQNPLPIIIPCHRVININGRLGGFSGGVEIKKHLLYLEVSTVQERHHPTLT